jgi:hypothetical protein
MDKTGSKGSDVWSRTTKNNSGKDRMLYYLKNLAFAWSFEPFSGIREKERKE